MTRSVTGLFAAAFITMSAPAFASDFSDSLARLENNIKVLASAICPKVGDAAEQLLCRIEFENVPLSISLIATKVTIAAAAGKPVNKAELDANIEKVLDNVQKLQEKYKKYTN